MYKRIFNDGIMITSSRKKQPSHRLLAAFIARNGAAVVEMAVVLPVFVTIMLGIIEIGRGMMVGQLVTNAAREGARLATMTGTTNAQVTSTVSTFLQNSTGASSSNVTVTITNSNAASGNTLTNAQTGDLITVQVSLPFSPVSFLPANYLAGKSMVASSSMTHE